MQTRIQWRVLLACLLATCLVIATALVVRGRLRDWTEHRLDQRLAWRIQSLPEDQAAALVRTLADVDGRAHSQLVPLLMDNRQQVALAAREAVDQWLFECRSLPADDAATCISELASELAAVGPKLPRESVPWAQSLATRLLNWPLGDPLRSAEVTRDCEVVLRLVAPEPDEIRIAAIDATGERDFELPDMQPPPMSPVPDELPGTIPPATTSEADPAIPRVYGPVEPGRLPGASEERPERPKQFLPPRAMRIDG